MTYTIHTKPGCPYCDNAKVLLWSRDLAYDEVRYTTVEEQAAFKAQFGNDATFPRVFAGTRHIGGYTELAAELG